MFKKIDEAYLFESFSFAFTLDFFSPLKIKELARKFSKNLGKKVKWFKETNKSFEPNNEIFKICSKYDSGFNVLEFSTGFIPYQEAIYNIFKIMNIINEIGHTDERSRLIVKIRLNEKKLNLGIGLPKINKVKYLLNLDENKIFELWKNDCSENRKIYQNELFFINPNRIFTTTLNIHLLEKLDSNEIYIPNSDFFGNDFSQIGKGYLIINYFGGKDYQHKKKELIDSLHIIIQNIYSTLLNNYKYTKEEEKKLNDFFSNYKNIINSIKNSEKLISNYPNIIFTVDLEKNKYLIESYYQIIKDKIFNLIAYGGMDSGHINYDSERKAIQVKNAKLKKAIIIENIEFFNCSIETDARNCLFKNCIIKNSKLNECTLYSDNFIKYSKLIECNYIQKNNEISCSYLESNNNKIIKANIRSSLIKNGIFSLDSKIDKSSKIIKS